MANKTQIRVEIVGDGSSAQKAFKDVESSAAQTDARLGTFGFGFTEAFVKIGRAVEVGQRAAGLVIDTLNEGARAVLAYSASVDQSTKNILGFTKSQEAVAAATALARKEADAGRGTYQETLEAIAALTPLTNKYGLSLQE